MFELFFGLVWTAISGVAAFAIFTSASEVGFTEMLFPIVFISVFLLIGFVFLYAGIKKIAKNILTKTKGIETYGYIINTYPNGTYVNDRPYYDAEILLVKEDGTIGRFTESIGKNNRKYYSGVYVNVKYYQNDINILDVVDEHSVSYNIKNRIESEIKSNNKYQDLEIGEFSNEEETIYIDGVEYVRKEEDTIIIDGIEYKRKR